MKQSWNNVKGLLTRMAEKMPEENYRFKPTPEMRDFGQRMAHAITFNLRGCAQVIGEQKTVALGATPSKASIPRRCMDTWPSTCGSSDRNER